MSDHDSATLSVLTSLALFRRMSSFSDGWPFSVYRFIATHGARYPSDSVERRNWFPELGILVEIAVAEGDTVMLGRLHQLRQFAHFRGREEVKVRGIASCAMYHQQAAVLEWIRVMMPAELVPVCEDPTLLRLSMRRAVNVCFAQWVYANCSRDVARFDVSALLFQAERGGLEIVQWIHLHDGDCGFTPAVMDIAAANGWLNMVRFLHEHRAEGCTANAMDDAARNGFLDVVQFLYER